MGDLNGFVVSHFCTRLYTMCVFCVVRFLSFLGFSHFWDLGIFLEQIHVYISFGSQDLSKNLNRVGGIDLGVEIYQNDHINVQTYQRTF